MKRFWRAAAASSRNARTMRRVPEFARNRMPLRAAACDSPKRNPARIPNGAGSREPSCTGLGATIEGLHLGNTWAGQRFLSERSARTGHTACAPGCAGSPPSLFSGLRRERLASGRPKLDNESFGPKIMNRFLPAVVYSLSCESDGRSSFERLPRAIFGVGCSLSVPVRPDTHCTGGSPKL